MKTLLSIVLIIMGSLLVTMVPAPTPVAALQTELGQLKVCKVARAGVAEGTIFTFRVNGNLYDIPAGPPDNGYCVLAGQYPVDAQVTIEEVIPSGYYVSRIEVKPDRTVSKDISQGIVTIRIASGVTEAIFANRALGIPTPTRRPTRTATSTPGCAPNCTDTPTPVPMGRLQICKEAEDARVTGYFTFRFGGRSKSVPVGACAGLISINAGALTITEVAQTGSVVADIYTIPADRLIGKDLSGGSARVKIVEGTAASQTIVIFRNRAMTITATDTSTPTLTATSTPTGSPTPTGTRTPPVPCQPEVIYAAFDRVPAGQSVEGAGAVAQFLSIKAKGQAVRALQMISPHVHIAPNDHGDANGGLIADGGFSDLQTRDLREPHHYTFTFEAGISIANFSLHMLDFGDFNPSRDASHSASLTAYDADSNVVSRQELSYTTPAEVNPRSSDKYGDLWFNGDAASAPLGQPGNWTWSVSGSGIVKVILEFGAGYDPRIAFDHLSFTKECGYQTLYSADFSNVPVGQPVEGTGVAARYLNIDAKGQAVRVLQATAPMAFIAPGGTKDVNGGLTADGGFADLLTRKANEPYSYTFTFDPGISVTDFSLHMLDYGDFNPTLGTLHYASMTAYDTNNHVIDSQELSYTTPAELYPGSSSSYGDLRLNGDAVSAAGGQPGNWTWHVLGSGIVKVVLEFGAGYDPNIAFDQLYFTIAR